MKATFFFATGWLTLTSCVFNVVGLPFNESQSIDTLPIYLAKRSQALRDSITSAGFEFIEPQSFFAISHKCKSDTRNLDRTKWSNRFDFYKSAITDATQIAKAAVKWPQLGTDASDLYMWPGLDSEDKKVDADNISKNIKAAADWEHPRWGFDPYITLTCDDPFKCCDNKVGQDPRPVACYISCCGPFFTLDDNETKFKFGKSKTIDDVGLDWMRTSGSFLEHEIMHTLKITQDRPKVIDQFFDGAAGRRVYGPKDCAKAARGEEPERGILNADSYAEFMLAMYWKDRFNGHLFKPVSTFMPSEAPAGFDPNAEQYELVSDNDNNHNDLESQVALPKLTCAGEPADKPSVKQAYTTGQIQKYCDLAVTGYIVNSTEGRYGPRGSSGGDSAPESDNTLWISLTKDPSCDENTGYEVEMGPCLNTLNTVLNGCNTDSVDKKWGGEAQAYCALWNITTRFGHDSTPPNGYR